MIPLVKRNLHQVRPIVDSGDQNLHLVDIGDQGPMDTSNRICLPLVDKYGWKVMYTWLLYQSD